jgi:hypothetical protein
VLFALRQHPTNAAPALGALDALRSNKAAEVESICTTYYEDFTRAMGELEVRPASKYMNMAFATGAYTRPSFGST